MILKISVLSAGPVLLDGKPIELDRLEETLKAAKNDNGVVYYYREAASADPFPQAMAVLKMVVNNKLAISLSSKPDFSDYVDAKGVSHPRTAPSGPLPMPAVVVRADIEEVFAEARKMAAGEKGPRGLVIVRPDRQYLLLPPPPESPELKAMAAGLERMIPSAVQRNIAVIGNTSFAAKGPRDAPTPPSITEVGKALPFFGNLMGLSYIGHAVCIFEGDATARAAGCHDADVLIVDSAMAPLLQPGWQEEVSKVMRNANILIQDRATFQLRFIRKAGQSRDRLEFPN